MAATEQLTVGKIGAYLHDKQLCFGTAHGLAYAAEDGNRVLVVPVMQDQPQQVCIAILTSG